MKILEPYDELGWVTAIIDDRWCQAKVYDLPLEYGINGGRVSILLIGKLDIHMKDKNFMAQLDYNYSRGLDFDNLPEGVLDSILEQLETLPLLKEQN